MTHLIKLELKKFGIAQNIIFINKEQTLAVISGFTPASLQFIYS